MTRQTMQGRPWMCSGPRKGRDMAIIGVSAMVILAAAAFALFYASMGGPRP